MRSYQGRVSNPSKGTALSAETAGLGKSSMAACLIGTLVIRAGPGVDNPAFDRLCAAAPSVGSKPTLELNVNWTGFINQRGQPAPSAEMSYLFDAQRIPRPMGSGVRRRPALHADETRHRAENRLPLVFRGSQVRISRVNAISHLAIIPHQQEGGLGDARIQSGLGRHCPTEYPPIESLMRFMNCREHIVGAVMFARHPSHPHGCVWQFRIAPTLRRGDG